MINDCLIVLCNLFRKPPIMKNEYTKLIIPVLIKYFKWFDQTEELDSILASINSENDNQSPLKEFEGKNRQLYTYVFSLK